MQQRPSWLLFVRTVLDSLQKVALFLAAFTGKFGSDLQERQQAAFYYGYRTTHHDLNKKNSLGTSLARKDKVEYLAADEYWCVQEWALQELKPAQT